MIPDIAWLAGFFEGEGTLRINKAGTRNLGVIHASVVSTDPDYVDAFQQRWPGYCKTTAARGNSRLAYRWNIGARKVGLFLDDVDPYLMGHRMRARIAVARTFLALKRSRTTKFVTDAYREESFNLYLLMRELNARGLDGPEPALIDLALTTCPDSDGWRRG